MNPTEIKSILQRLGTHPNKRLGQHFLIDQQALETIVEAGELKRGDVVLEIGPGLGVLTQALLERGAIVKAVERDRRFAAYLQEIMKERFILIEGDATRVDWGVARPWKFISNLPYSITSFVLREALWRDDPPEKIVVLVQREVAERAIAKEGKQSLLSLMIALRSSSARMVRRVPRGAFYPPPKVESAILEMVPLDHQASSKRWGIDPARVMAIAKQGFAHPRKLLASNLGIRDTRILSVVGLDEKIRAEAVSVEQWVSLAKHLDVR
jgi:16S rRNA (adenine1518-N6/adenine1519-N6)-dimethyltransferase